MDVLLILLVGTAIAGAIAWRILSRPGKPAAAPEAPRPAPRTIQQLGEELKPAYEASAHPQELESHPAFHAGVEQLANPDLPLGEVVNYCIGANQQLAAMAGEALARRADSAPAVPRLISHFRFAYVWTDYYMLRALERHAADPVVCRVLLETPEWWLDNALIPQFLSAFADARAAKGEPIDLGAELNARPREDLAHFEALLAKLTTPLGQRLRAQLDEWRRTRVDQKFLGSIGRVWRADGDDSPIIEHDALDAGVELALDAVLTPPAASFVILGEPGTGKSTLFRALAARLAERGWTVFEASAPEVLAGMTYIGELEGRVRKLLEALDVARRIVWYVPNLHELFYAGRHRWSPVGLLDLVLPAMEEGRIVLIGEAQPAAFVKVLQQRPRLRSVLKSLLVEPLPAKEALALAREFVGRSAAAKNVTVEPDAVSEALDLARHYLGTRALPGSVIDLLRHTLKRAAGSGAKTIGRAELFGAMTEITGLPGSVLDDREGLDLAALRSHFETRVMGQPEAVQCVVDRIAMLKAGLVDPNRPIGVFLFAGPTGTGKTEVARTLAEFLFGAASRMIRLDMSEFQEPGSLGRILGEAAEGAEVDALVHRIRKQPFSVLLLDEFEKSHPRVWDLFLQVFDEGRLTDALGTVADFRHAIIILTSNIGGAEHRGASLGFTGGDGAFSHGQVERAIANTFRPEFVNRLDRIVVFGPLSRAVMRDILRKELRNVLQRRGFRSRDWAVEWEESAIEFLLEKGFTANMGARPLRRAIETYVLAPIAMTIVDHRHPEGDQFLFVRSDGNSIQVEFVDPDAPAEAVPAEMAARTLTIGPLVLSPSGSEPERRFLEARMKDLCARLEGDEWSAQKQGLLREMNRPGFWEDPGRYAVLDKVERMDRIEAGAGTARALMARIENPARGNRAPRQIVSSLAEQLHLLGAAIADLDGGKASDVYLLVESVGANGEWPHVLAGMYRQWAKKRRMRTSILSDGAGKPFVMAVAGFGAHHILAPEAGLHLLEVPDARGGFDRHTARVRIAPQPVTPRPSQQTELEFALSCLGAKGDGSNTVVRRYRERPSPLVRDAVAGWRTGRLAQALGGDFDLLA